MIHDEEIPFILTSNVGTPMSVHGALLILGSKVPYPRSHTVPSFVSSPTTAGAAPAATQTTLPSAFLTAPVCLHADDSIRESRKTSIQHQVKLVSHFLVGLRSERCYGLARISLTRCPSNTPSNQIVLSSCCKDTAHRWNLWFVRKLSSRFQQNRKVGSPLPITPPKHPCH